MPIYEYKCSNCSNEFEQIQKISDKPVKKCPNCNKNSVSKMMSAPSFRLKGSGWYETDFKTGNKKNIVDSNATTNETNKDKASKVNGKQRSEKQKSSKKDT